MRQRRWTFTTLTALSGVAGLLIALLLIGRLFGPAQPPEPKPDVAPPPGINIPSPSPPVGPPRLAVLLVVDQLCADYLTRWDNLFEDGGFHRLEREGAWFTNCNYPYAITVTGAGHASLATGCSPDRHGIISNTWFDRKALPPAPVYCASGDFRTSQVPPEILGPGKKPGTSASPRLLKAQTLADSLKEATGNKGRVVSLSCKDRGACFTGGQKPDACYWFNTTTGTFVTSTWYRDAPHAWVAAFNKEQPANRHFADWKPSRPAEVFKNLPTPMDLSNKGSAKEDRKDLFSHPVKTYEAVYSSPFGNDLLLELVKKAVDAEQLGRRETMDLLCVSFSSNDPVGHAYGPDSPEVLDTTLRTDRLIKDLLDFLDSYVGKGRYTIVLSADHGVCPLPEIEPQAGEPARRRVHIDGLQAEAEEMLRRNFPGPAGPAIDWVGMDQTPFFYLNKEWMKLRDLTPVEVENALGGWLAGRPETLTFYTRTRLEHGLPLTDEIGQRVLKSFYKERSGDVFMVTRPYFLLASGPNWRTGTSHGTPHLYDTHVPLLVFGPGVNPGKRQDAVTPQAAAPILAKALGVPSPKLAEAVVPSQLFRGPP